MRLLAAGLLLRPLRLGARVGSSVDPRSQEQRPGHRLRRPVGRRTRRESVQTDLLLLPFLANAKVKCLAPANMTAERLEDYAIKTPKERWESDDWKVFRRSSQWGLA